MEPKHYYISKKYYLFVLFVFRFIGVSTYEIYSDEKPKQNPNKTNLFLVEGFGCRIDDPDISSRIQSLQELNSKYNGMKRKLSLVIWSKIVLVLSYIYGFTIPIFFYYILKGRELTKTVDVSQMINIINEVFWFLCMNTVLFMKDELLANLFVYLRWLYKPRRDITWSPIKDKVYFAFILIRIISLGGSIVYGYFVVSSEKYDGDNPIISSFIIIFYLYTLMIALYKFFIVFTPVILFYGVNLLIRHMYVEISENIVSCVDLKIQNILQEDRFIISTITNNIILNEKPLSKEYIEKLRKVMKTLSETSTSIFSLNMLQDYLCLYFSGPIAMIFCQNMISIIVSFFTFTVIPDTYEIGLLFSISSAFTLFILCRVADVTEGQVSKYNKYFIIYK